MTTSAPPARTRRTSRDERVAVAVVAVVGAVVAALGSAAPTGIRGVDALYLAVCGALLPVAGSRARRYTWILSALLALWVAPTTIGRLLALVAGAVGVWAAATRRRRWAGAVVGLLLVPVLGDLGAGPFLGSTTLFAVLAAAPMLASAVVHLPVRRQRMIGAVISVAAAASLVAAIMFVTAMALALDEVNDGVEAARTGFDLANDGDGDAAASSFVHAGDLFDDARFLLGGPWSLPARLVPGLGQHIRAAQVVVSEGTSLAEVAADAVDDVDPDEVRIVDGTVDLAVIDGLAPTLDRVERSLRRAHDRITDARTPWLVGPIEARLDDLVVELDDAVPAARTASLAARHAPEMLGARAPVEWLVLLTTPAEARGLGGLVGNYVRVRVDDGLLEIVETGRNEDLNELLEANDAVLEGPADFVDRWGQGPARFFQDVTLSPDLPTVGTVASDLYAQATGVAVDGVVVLDPLAVSAILSLTGPVTAGDRRLDESTVVDFLLYDQYVVYADDETGRVAALEALVTGAFDLLVTSVTPSPRVLADTLGPVVDEDRLGVWWGASAGPTELVEAAGLAGAFPVPDGGDLLGVVHQNAGQNKLDVYLERAVDYRLAVDGDRVTATAEIVLANRVPEEDLPLSVIGNNDQGYPLGTNVARVSVHTALDLVEARLDGTEIAVEREAAYGAEAITALVEIPPGGERRYEVDLTGPVDGPYRLVLAHQPLVNADQVSVEVIDGDRTRQLRAGAPLTRDEVVSVDG